jgi:hypothetical protein
MFIAKEAAEGYRSATIDDAWDKEIEGLIGELVTRITELKKSGAGGRYIIPIPAFMIIQTRNTSE